MMISIIICILGGTICGVCLVLIEREENAKRRRKDRMIFIKHLNKNLKIGDNS